MDSRAREGGSETGDGLVDGGERGDVGERDREADRETETERKRGERGRGKVRRGELADRRSLDRHKVLLATRRAKPACNRPLLAPLAPRDAAGPAASCGLCCASGHRDELSVERLHHMVLYFHVRLAETAFQDNFETSSRCAILPPTFASWCLSCCSPTEPASTCGSQSWRHKCSPSSLQSPRPWSRCRLMGTSSLASHAHLFFFQASPLPSCRLGYLVWLAASLVYTQGVMAGQGVAGIIVSVTSLFSRSRQRALATITAGALEAGRPRKDRLPRSVLVLPHQHSRSGVDCIFFSVECKRPRSAAFSMGGTEQGEGGDYLDGHPTDTVGDWHDPAQAVVDNISLHQGDETAGHSSRDGGPSVPFDLQYFKSHPGRLDRLDRLARSDLTDRAVPKPHCRQVERRWVESKRARQLALRKSLQM